ncbi:nuclear transport factor 2 family protein [Brevibacillus laterosporus]|uniref:nuclear transport factor 2 family protein n=1 Tax=Brevibacillus laterosporus TaxID=1465 RepID=UPI003D233CF0
MDEIQKLVSIEEISNLKARYVRYADEKKWSQLAELFTPDAIFEAYDEQGNLHVQMRGHEEIRNTINNNVGAAQPIHHIFSCEFDVTSATTAKAVWAMEDNIIFPQGAGSEFSSIRGYGHYHDSYIKIDGEWFIQSLKITRVKMEFIK